MDFILDNVYLFLLISAILHFIEEYVYPGGYAARLNDVLDIVDLSINKFQIILINILFFGLILFVLFEHNNYPLLSLGAVFLVFLNGMMHLFTSIKQKRYFPGLITGVVLYLPLGVITFLYLRGDLDLKIMALFLAGILLSVPFLIILVGKPFIKKF
jgi:hypothetical protein